MTVRDALAAALTDALQQHSPEEVAPCCVVWTDKAELWKAVMPSIRQVMPGLLTYGGYDPSSKTGPAIWIRCMLAGVLDSPMQGTPVVYLPGVGRKELRNAEEAARPLQPLIELQYRGILWVQPRGKDWTPAAFLRSLGLDVAADEDTKIALQERLHWILSYDLEELRNQGRLDAVKVRNLGADWPAAILAWLEKPTERGDDWAAFRAACTSQYKFDPQSDGELVAGEHLAQANGSWGAVWARFALAPQRFPGTVETLRRVSPPGIFDRDEGYPSKNREKEGSLRGELAKASKKDPFTARKRVIELEAEHGLRRKWVWNELGESPLAACLEYLAKCAQVTGTALGATSVEELIRRYTEQGWQADQAAWRAYAAVDAQDAELIGELLRTIYLPWIQSAAEVFSALCQKSPLKSLWSQVSDPAPGECLLFVDGLRYDVAKLLEAELLKLGTTAELGSRVSGLPSVTATAKPAVSPISDLFTGTGSGAEFRPTIIATGKAWQMEVFRSLLVAKGIQVLENNDAGDSQGCGWAESGAFDRLGHDEGAGLAKRIPEEVKKLCERIRALLDAGWKTVRIVTDHGWLWMPGGLPRAELPAYLVESRWGRCAALRGNATTDHHTVPWHYNPSVAIVVPPGVSCFRAGIAYSHGGLSVQECVIPVLTVSRKAGTMTATIESVVWVGMRCKVKATGGAGLRADIRTKPAESTSSVAHELKSLDAAGLATLLVSDDHEELAVVVVLIDEVGQVVAKASTCVGGSE